MYCLYNGEYGEHDLTYIKGLDGILKIQEESYKPRIGMIVGDFTCLDIEYDWGRHDQRWKCQCNICGKVIYRYHAQDWVRGKGQKRECGCVREAEKAKKAAEVAERKRIAEEKRINAERIREEKAKRTHVDYTEEKYRNVRYGNVISQYYIGSNLYHFKCDCGREFDDRATNFFRYKKITTCRDKYCPHYMKKRYASNEQVGYDFEKEVVYALERAGYQCDSVGQTGDFGVDIIVFRQDVGEIAVQCKKRSGPVNLNCVQEVYAGGRYYGLEKFAVISSGGFTPATVKMARRLGVYLCDDAEAFEYPADIQDYAEKLLPVYSEHESRKRYYEIEGKRKTLVEWCVEYGVSDSTVRSRMNHGLPLEKALLEAKKGPYGKRYVVDGFEGNITQIGDRFGILPATISYRMKYRGMSIDEAVKTPIQTKHS